MATNSPSQRVAHSIKDLMRARRISQEVLATRLRVSQQAVSRRLTGDVEFSGSQLIEVAEILDVTLDDLMSAAPSLTAGGDTA